MPDTWYSDHPRCAGCPHPPYVHAHQLWAPMRKQAGREGLDPWLTQDFKARHVGMGRGELALAWLEETFAP